jgi:hypothetical protein
MKRLIKFIKILIKAIIDEYYDLHHWKRGEEIENKR